MTGAREPRAFADHAMEFGDVVVRQAAYRRAAEQMADAIAAAIH
jgi:hypothetical protein